MSQPPPGDEEGAAVQQMAELLQTCAALKSAFDAAVKRITALEKQHDAVCRELTSMKLTLQWPGQMPPVKASYSAVVIRAAGSTKENDASSDSSLDAVDHELAATCPESINATIPAAPITMTRTRHLSDSSDVTITEYIAPTSTVEPAVGFTLPANDRRRLGRQKRQPRVMTLASDIRETTAIATQNRFEVLGDREPAEITLRVVKPPTAPRKVYVGTFDPDTSETMMRAYLRRHVIENEMEITDVQKLLPQSRTTVMACSFCITVDSTTARNALFDKRAWPSGVTVRDFKPHIPKSAGSRQGCNAGYGSGAWRDRHDRPSRIQAGRQGDGRRVEQLCALREHREPRGQHAGVNMMIVTRRDLATGTSLDDINPSCCKQ